MKFRTDEIPPGWNSARMSATGPNYSARGNVENVLDFFFAAADRWQADRWIPFGGCRWPPPSRFRVVDAWTFRAFWLIEMFVFAFQLGAVCWANIYLFHEAAIFGGQLTAGAI